MHPKEVIKEAKKEVEDDEKAQTKLTNLCYWNKSVDRVSRSVSWRQQADNTFKANWDDTLDEKNSKMVIGVVVRDCIGELIAACSVGKDHVSSKKISEIYAFKRAMLLCAEIGLFSVIFEGDAKAVIEELKLREDSWAPYGQPIEEVKHLCKDNSSWTISFVPREGNKAAHLIAKHALTDTREVVWMEDIPSCIFKCVLNDTICTDC